MKRYAQTNGYIGNGNAATIEKPTADDWKLESYQVIIGPNDCNYQGACMYFAAWSIDEPNHEGSK